MELNDIRARLEAVVNSLYNADGGGGKSADWLLSGRIDGFDSVLVLRLVLAIEQEFGIAIQDNEILPETFADLHVLSKLVQRKAASLSHDSS